MVRPRRLRRVCFCPKVNYFKPAGIPMPLLEEVELNQEELEALRLQNLEELDQSKAAKKMKVSQPTFHRMIQEARKKVTDALVNSKAIRIQGGNFTMVQPRGRGLGMGRGAGGRGRRGGQFAAGPGGNCVCPKCGAKSPKSTGTPCTSQKCPKCKTQMIREM